MDNFKSDIATAFPLCLIQFHLYHHNSLFATYLHDERMPAKSEYQSKYSFINRLCKSYYASIVDLSSESIVLKSIKQHDIAITVPTPTDIITS